MARRKHRPGDRLPTVFEVCQNPELAVLAVLTSILEAADDATLIAWPELGDLEPRPPGDDTEVLRHADAIIRQTHRLGETIRRYRNALADFLDAKAKAQRSEDIPF